MADLSERLADTVLLAMKAALSPVLERIAALEARPAVPGPPGPAGADGKDGEAGVTADALTVAQDGEDERVITFGVKAGDTVTSWGTVRLTLPRYCGVYDTARTYTAGDQVTHAGSLWSCTATTNMRPGGGSGWVLQVKQGKG